MIDDFGRFEELAVLVLLQRCQELMIALVYRSVEREGALLEVLGLHAECLEAIELLCYPIALLAELLVHFTHLFDLFLLLLRVLFELLDRLLTIGQLFLVLLLVLLELVYELLVFGLQLLDSVLDTLDVQLELLLDPDVLPDIGLEILNEFLV